MPTDRTIGHGIIGCGVIGPWHAQAINAIEGSEIVAVCDVVEERAKEMAEKFGGEPCTDYKEMVKRDDIDIVNICTPSGMHADMGVAAAEAGKHIVSEKPLDVTLEACDRIIEACKQNNVLLSGIFQNRFADGSTRIKEALEQGRFGNLTMGDAYVKWWRTQEYYDSGDWRATWDLDGGGALMNQSVHYIDLLQWFMGPVKTIYARTATLAHTIEVEDCAAAVIGFENGAIGVIEGTTAAAPGGPARLEIHGDKGTAGWENGRVSTWKFADEREGDDQVTKAEKFAEGAASDPRAMSIEGHRRNIAALVDAVRTGAESPLPGEEARKAVEIIRGIYTSAEEGREVTLPL
jgi:UDP-N-acetyl-2-amino-2-deoxyglucuronate dehydrogenase